VVPVTFELKAHPADVAVEATGESLGAVFGAVADGMAAAMADDIPATGGTRFDIEVRAESREALLFDYLDRLIYERDVREVLPVDNEVAVRQAGEDWVVSGSARGIPLSDVEARDLKAVTYSQMDLSERAGGWHAYVVFDV